MKKTPTNKKKLINKKRPKTEEHSIPKTEEHVATPATTKKKGPRVGHDRSRGQFIVRRWKGVGGTT